MLVVNECIQEAPNLIVLYVNNESSLNTLELVGKQESAFGRNQCSDSSISHDFAFKFIPSAGFISPQTMSPQLHQSDSLSCALGNLSNKCR